MIDLNDIEEDSFFPGRMLTALREWSQKRRLRAMLKDPRSKRRFRSMAQLDKGIGADRPTTERLLLSIGASFHRRSMR
jgi:hypothetical protein